MWRGIGQAFVFGAQPPLTELEEEGPTPATIDLKLIQGWRIFREGRTILGSQDHGQGEKRRFYDRKTPPRDPEERLRWQRAKAWFAEVEAETRTVVEVSVSSAFEPRLRLDDGTTIEASHTSSYSGNELWWFAEGDKSILTYPDGDNGFRDFDDDAP